MSPLLPSIINKMSLLFAFLQSDASNAMPFGPSCSNKAICGFIAGIKSKEHSKREKQNFSTFL